LVYAYAFIKDAIQRDVKEDGREKIGEKVENDGRRYLSATGVVELPEAVTLARRRRMDYGESRTS
jgi:hypothetical protein